MKQPRFNLRTLLVAVTLLAIFLGYAQSRRQNILREAKALESQGFTLMWQDTWANSIWPVVPKEARFEYYEVSESKWRIGAGIYSLNELDEHYAQACDRLYALGVEEVRLDKEGKRSNRYTGTRRGMPPPASSKK